MIKFTRYSFFLFDLVIQILPVRIRNKFIANNAILKLLVKAGGIRRSMDQIRNSGFDGKWTESAESTPLDEKKLVTSLMDSLEVMKQKQENCSSAYMPAHEWLCLLQDEWKQPLTFIRNKDVASMSVFLRNFFRNEGVSGFWGQRKMFERFQNKDTVWELTGEYLMFREMEVLNEYLPGWNVKDLDAPRVGNPWGYSFQGVLLYEPVFQYYWQAEYFNRLMGSVQQPVVLEIGGGFGGLASHLLKRNSQIRYVGLDLPENIVIQAYYLSCVFPELRVYIYDENFSLLNRKMLETYDVVLLPNFCLPQIDTGVVDMLVNVRSLSEMGQETIDEYYCQIERIKPRFFFHENIFRERGDGLHGIPSNRYPVLKNYRLIYSGPSRWIRYGPDSIYPCHENLFQCNDKC